MICNRCGKEFGTGDTCRHCGADKVGALGEFNGYPERGRESPHMSSSPGIPYIDTLSTSICWKCGEIIPIDSKYCPFCGEQLFVSCPKCGHIYSGTNREQYLKQQKKQREDNERLMKKEEEVRRQAELQKQKERSEQRGANLLLFVFFGVFTLWLILTSSEWFPILFGK